MRGATPGKNYKKHFQKMKEKPEIQVQILKPDKFSGVLWEIIKRYIRTYIYIYIYIYMNHVAPRMKLYAPNNDFPIRLDFIDVQRQTKTSRDVLQEATVVIIGTWMVTSHWICVTRFALLPKSPPEGYMCVQGRLKKRQVTTRPANIWHEEWPNMSKGSQRKAINKWAEEKQKIGRCETFTVFQTMILIVKKS